MQDWGFIMTNFILPTQGAPMWRTTCLTFPCELWFYTWHIPCKHIYLNCALLILCTENTYFWGKMKVQISPYRRRGVGIEARQRVPWLLRGGAWGAGAGAARAPLADLHGRLPSGPHTARARAAPPIPVDQAHNTTPHVSNYARTVWKLGRIKIIVKWN